MTTEQFLTILTGWLISALFKYVPGVAASFEKLNGLGKRLGLIAFVLVVSLAAFALKCSGLLTIPQIFEPCTRPGWGAFAEIAWTVAISTQVAYLLLPTRANALATPQSSIKIVPGPEQ